MDNRHHLQMIWKTLQVHSANPSWLKKTFKRFSLVVRNGTFQFIFIFSSFILAGASLMYLLEGRGKENAFSTFFESFWFTVVTITTVGYGDMAPQSHLAQLVAMGIMFLGILLVGIMSGNVASMLVEANRKKAMGLAPLPKLEGHTIICGWKGEMKEILLGILVSNPAIHSTDLVLVNTHQPAEIGDLKRDKRLRGVHFVFGEHTERMVLEQARVKKADRVMILAETNSGKSPDEIDSRTVLAANSVQHLNQVVYTCTELIQPHFSRYLKHARVEEVVLSEDNALSLLVAGSLGNGLANVISRFFPENGGMLQVLPVPPQLAHGTYGDLAAYFSQMRLAVVGLVENMGNLYDLKRQWLREAIKTEDYRKAIQGLREVAVTESNQAYMSPPDHYPIPPNSRVVVLLSDNAALPADLRKERMSVRPPVTGKKHETLVICGWKPNMATLVRAILHAHIRQGRPLKGLTVVSRMPEAERRDVQAAHDLEGVVLVEGDTKDPEVLRRAKIQAADRVLILAPEHLKSLSLSEADAHSVMTSLAVLDINRLAYKSVEILDPDFAKQLAISETEEIILTHRYRQVMLSQASNALGSSSAQRALLDRKLFQLQVMDFPQIGPGKTFEDYQKIFRAKGITLVGVLENSGSSHVQKKDYLYQAQIQPRIRNSIRHLNQMKKIISNEPKLNPPLDYIPGTHSLAIVIFPSREETGSLRQAS